MDQVCLKHQRNQMFPVQSLLEWWNSKLKINSFGHLLIIIIILRLHCPA